MFLINSRLENGSCGPSPLRAWGRSYPEVTTTFLPSSFRSFHTFTLAHLRQPTCVGLRYGLIPLMSLRLFLEECSLGFPALRRSCRGTPQLALRQGGLYYEQKSDNSPELLLFVILKKHGTRGRNINLLSIPSPYSGARLGPPNPWMIIIAKETLGFRCGRLSLPLRLLMPTFSLLIAPPNLSVKLHS